MIFLVEFVWLFAYKLIAPFHIELQTSSYLLDLVNLQVQKHLPLNVYHFHCSSATPKYPYIGIVFSYGLGLSSSY